jgi:hypothetical protein
MRLMGRQGLQCCKSVLRRARRAGSLTADERASAAVARVPTKAQQKRYLAKLAAGINNPKP